MSEVKTYCPAWRGSAGSTLITYTHRGSLPDLYVDYHDYKALEADNARLRDEMRLTPDEEIRKARVASDDLTPYKPGDAKPVAGREIEFVWRGVPCHEMEARPGAKAWDNGSITAWRYVDEPHPTIRRAEDWTIEERGRTSNALFQWAESGITMDDAINLILDIATGGK